MRLFLAGLLVVLAAGPAYPQNKDILQLQKDMIDVQQWVKQLQGTVDRNDAALKSLVEKMADQVNSLSGGIQKITQTVDGIKGQTDATTRDIRTILAPMNTALKDLQEEIAGMRTQVSSISKEIRETKTTAEPLAGPNDLWRSAYVDYSAANYDLAIAGYQEFLQKFPMDERIAEAHLNIGNALMAQKKFGDAVNEYDIVLQKFPESDKTRTALLKKGLALETTQPQQAIATLNEVVKRFPNTSEASSAQAKLRELQPPRKAPGR